MRNSFLILNSKDPTSNKIKLSYKRQEVFSSNIPRDPNFTGFLKTNNIHPRITIREEKGIFPPRLRRQETDISTFSTDSLHSSSSSVDLKHLFNNKNTHDNMHILITGLNRDLQLLIQDLSYNWAIDELWGQFDHVIYADLGSLLTHNWKTKTVSGNRQLNPFTQFLYTFLKEFSININDIETILDRKTSHTLIILKGYEKISHLLDHEHYPHIKAILKQASQYNLIVTSEHSGESTAKSIFQFDIILDDKGLFPRDIKKFLHKNSPDESSYQALLQFFESNPNIEAICRSPNILQMVFYILLHNKDLELQSSTGSATISSIYYDMISLNGCKICRAIY